MAVLRTTIVVTAVALVVSCIGTSPQERDPAVQGNYDDGDEEHRPGQPCLLCHGEGHVLGPPGGALLALAGTVYGAIDDPETAGLDNVTVKVTDATGLELSVQTNRAGNFMFSVGTTEIRDRGRGQLDIPRALTYPLGVTITRGTDTQTMKTKVWREGSCAHCHQATPGTDSVGRVYLLDPVIP
jgi:hypothetical protein